MSTTTTTDELLIRRRHFYGVLAFHIFFLSLSCIPRHSLITLQGSRMSSISYIIYMPIPTSSTCFDFHVCPCLLQCL